MIAHKYSTNALFISIAFFISNAKSVEYKYENKTDFYNTFNNNNSFTQILFKDLIKKYQKNFEVIHKDFVLNNQTLSDVSFDKISNYNQTNSSILLSKLLEESDKNERNASAGANIAGESRTLSSWLGLRRFRKPEFKLNPFVTSAQTRPQPQAIHPFMSPQLMPQFMTRPNSFPGPHDPDSLLLPSSMFEESGIKYWLKFIENVGKDDITSSDEHYSPPLIQNSRMRRPANVIAPTSVRKPIDIGEKPVEEMNNSEDDFYDENDGIDDESEEDSNDEPKSSGSTSSQNKHTFDTTPRCDKFTADICVDDFEYPEQAIVDEIYKRKDLFELMYSEVRDNVPLVDGIPRDVEESYSYDYYYNDNKDPQTSSSEFGETQKTPSSPGRGFVCPSEVLYGKPKLAKNKKGEWKVIVNAAEFTQTVRMEKCLRPNSKCNYISYPDFDSRCAQVHAFHRLLVFEKGKGFYIDTFRMPTACTCHVVRKVTYKPVNSASMSNQYNKKRKPSPALSNTLWSILGGGNNDDSEALSQSQELVRNQINLLQQLKHFPQLSHISPENVFQQLMDFQSSPNTQGLSLRQKGYQMPQKSDSMAFAQNGMEYMPEIVINEDDLKSQSQMSRPIAQIHQSSGTTTLLNPNSNGAAPVVQVIHLPITTVGNGEPAPVYKPKPNLSFNDYSYSDPSSLFYKQKSNSDEFLQTFSDDLSHLSADHFKPLLLGLSSKTNSSLMSPNSGKENVKRESDYLEAKNAKNSSDSDETNKKRKVMVESTLNKKINFSYHPILEYITN